MKIGKLHIHLSFIPLFLLMIALGLGSGLGNVSLDLDHFFILLISATIHEFSHVFLAMASKITVNKIIITPIGEIAEIGEIEKLSEFRKLAIMAIGPLVNLLIAGIFFLLPYKNSFTESIMVINLALGTFNLLPVHPLDGGKMLQIWLGNRLGFKKSFNVINIIRKIGSIFFICAGIVQLVLYPYNISLIAVAAFFLILEKRERLQMVFSFYRALRFKKEKTISELKTVNIAFDVSENVYSITQHFTWDRIHIIHVIRDGTHVKTITEFEIMDYAEKNDIQNTVIRDILALRTCV